jgi:hypothetical protein
VICRLSATIVHLVVNLNFEFDLYLYSFDPSFNLYV